MSSYLSSSNLNSRVLLNFLRNQINMGYPVMPRVTDDLRRRYFRDSNLEWPSINPEFIFPEEYEMVEHQIKGKSYETNLSGEVNALLGKIFGRGEIKAGDTISIIAPTNYQIQVLCKQKIPLSRKLNINFLADLSAKRIEIKREK